MKAILKKLHKIQSEVEKMEKDGKNTFQNYSYLSETQVTIKMKRLLEENGVVFSHSSKIVHTHPFLNAKGVQNFLTNVEVGYSFYDVESGEVITGTSSGQGTDSGDKGVYKAITGAIKYIFMKNFMIPTGDDPEKDNNSLNRATQAPYAGQTSSMPQSVTTPPVAPPQPEYVNKMNNYKKPVAGDKCERCGAEMILNPKTSKVFCQEKCWLNK